MPRERKPNFDEAEKQAQKSILTEKDMRVLTSKLNESIARHARRLLSKKLTSDEKL